MSLSRVFMSVAGREELSSLVNELWVNCTAEGGPVNRGNQIKDDMHRIQCVLERELDYVPWRVRWLFK